MNLEDYKKEVLQKADNINKKIIDLGKESRDLSKNLDPTDIYVVCELVQKLNVLVALILEKDNLISQIVDLNKIENE